MVDIKNEKYKRDNTGKTYKVKSAANKPCARCGVMWAVHDRCPLCRILLHSPACDCTEPREAYTNKIYDREFNQRKRII